jgi:hypothetical protein
MLLLSLRISTCHKQARCYPSSHGSTCLHLHMVDGGVNCEGGKRCEDWMDLWHCSEFWASCYICVRHLYECGWRVLLWFCGCRVLCK